MMLIPAVTSELDHGYLNIMGTDKLLKAKADIRCVPTRERQ